MAFKYDKLWDLLSVRGINKDKLRKQIGASQTTIVSMGKNKNVSLDVIDRICDVLQCDPFEIMEHVPNLQSQFDAIPPRHGDIYNVNFLDDDKVRPAIILQNDSMTHRELTVMVVPLATMRSANDIDYSSKVTMVINATVENGLNKDSRALINNMCQVQKFQLVNKVGELNERDLAAIKSCVNEYLGWI